jgi:type II secretory pathway component PulF
MIYAFLSFLGLMAIAVLTQLPGMALVAVLYYLFSLPLVRRDRARFFLDLLETALDQGRPIEMAIISAAESRDPAMGVDFYLLAAHLEQGRRLGEALDAVPSFLPPQINAILKAGEKMGDLKRVLPACREVMRMPPDSMRNTVHYMVGILLLTTPGMVALVSWMSFRIIPIMKDVMAGMGIEANPVTIAVFTLADSNLLIIFEVSVSVLLVAAVLIYIGGPAFVRKFQVRFFPLVDWIAWQVPWKRKKLLRTFSAMLAVLLDSGVPETEAVRLAGDATANAICRARAMRVLKALANGMKLDDAVRGFDDNGEFHWRLANAVHGRGGFLAALRGWHAALDAKAYQQQETATNFAASGLVIFNGVMVGLIAIGLFGVITGLMKAMAFAP